MNTALTLWLLDLSTSPNITWSAVPGILHPFRSGYAADRKNPHRDSADRILLSLRDPLCRHGAADDELLL